MVLTFATALVEPWFVALLTKWGFYRFDNQAIGDTLNWIARIVGDTNFLWMAGMVFGALFGMVMYHMAVKFDRKDAKQKNIDLAEIGIDLSFAKREVTSFIANPQGSNRRIKIIDPTLPISARAKVASLFARLKSHGIQSPPVYEKIDTRQAQIFIDYIDSISPFLSENQRKEAKLEAIKIVTSLKVDDVDLNRIERKK